MGHFLLREMFPNLVLRITATDADPEMLARAGRAVFSYTSVKDLPASWRQAAFVRRLEAVRGGGRWQDTPLVALSSATTPQALDRGREVGFTDYVAKSDRDALLYTLSETLAVAGGRA